MAHYAKGLKLEITDRDEYDSFIRENAHDPGVHYDTWGEHSVPDTIYIESYNAEDDHPYYTAYNKHVNNTVTKQYIGEDIIQDAIEAGVLEHTDEYDIEFVNTQ